MYEYMHMYKTRVMHPVQMRATYARTFATIFTSDYSLGVVVDSRVTDEQLKGNRDVTRVFRQQSAKNIAKFNSFVA